LGNGKNDANRYVGELAGQAYVRPIEEMYNMNNATSEVLKYSGLYGAIIATLGLIWNIYNAKKSREKKVTVKITSKIVKTEMPIQELLLSYSVIINIECINKGNKSINIDNIYIKTKRVNNFIKIFVSEYAIKRDDVPLILELKEGKKYKQNYEYENIASLIQFENEKYLLIELIDVEGKKYYSNLLKISEIEEISLKAENKNNDLREERKKIRPLQKA